MQQQLLTEVYGFLFLLLIVASLIRSFRRRSKRTSPNAMWTHTLRVTRWYLFRLGTTLVVGLVIAATLTNDPAMLVSVWVALWVGLYWLWKIWDRWRGKSVPYPANEPRAIVMVPVPQALEAVTRPARWRQVVRKTVRMAAGAVVLIAVMAFVMTLCLGYYERQAKSERNKVQKGMTVDEVLRLVHRSCGIRTHAVLPDNVSDEEGVHYASLFEHEDGTFGWSSGPDYQSRQLTEDEAAGLMKQKMSDGYDWRWRYTFINDTPQHFSFTVTFGRDGRVKDVTDVWGWD
jgi:hypothetical protein